MSEQYLPGTSRLIPLHEVQLAAVTFAVPTPVGSLTDVGQQELGAHPWCRPPLVRPPGRWERPDVRRRVVLEDQAEVLSSPHKEWQPTPGERAWPPEDTGGTEGRFRLDWRKPKPEKPKAPVYPGGSGYRPPDASDLMMAGSWAARDPALQAVRVAEAGKARERSPCLLPAGEKPRRGSPPEPPRAAVAPVVVEDPWVKQWADFCADKVKRMQDAGRGAVSRAFAALQHSPIPEEGEDKEEEPIFVGSPEQKEDAEAFVQVRKVRRVMYSDERVRLRREEAAKGSSDFAPVLPVAAAPKLLVWESLGLTEFKGLVRLGASAAVDRTTDAMVLADQAALAVVPKDWGDDDASWLTGQVMGLLLREYPPRVSLLTETGDACPFLTTNHFWRARLRLSEVKRTTGSEEMGMSPGCMSSAVKEGEEETGGQTGLEAAQPGGSRRAEATDAPT
jgi:hypothetical protein